MSDQIQPVSLTDWGFSETRPFIISGPCGVESEKQIHVIAEKLRDLPVHMMRGGIWKPRTRPDSFQGIGITGLKWLKEAGDANNLPVCVEVAGPRHVEQALKAGIDVLWIGARTTVNPFLVQEIADSLAGVDVPVMIKNPINPDLDLWIGALERIFAAGINKLAAIHRGFSTFEKTKYRNVPNWKIPIELKRRFPSLPIICDPSHISGNRELLSMVSQTALDLNFDGLMIESHHDPVHALSDREQQVTPDELETLLSSLVIRQPSVNDIIFLNLLEELRDRIDRFDEDILVLLAERMNVAKEIGQYKRENNMTIFQLERWEEILRTRGQSGLAKDLTPGFIKKLYELIHEESIYHQTQVMNSSEIDN